jgi:hypothetical protein
MSSNASGAGAFQWNAGGWFGSQVGGTLWMLVGAAVLLPRAPAAALVWLGSFTAANALGLALWARRDRLRPYPALQLLLAALAVLSAGNMIVADLAGQLPSLAGGGGQWSNPRAAAYGALLVFPALMLLFWLKERSAARPT